MIIQPRRGGKHRFGVSAQVLIARLRAEREAAAMAALTRSDVALRA